MEKHFYVTSFTLFLSLSFFLSLSDDIVYLEPAAGCARSRFYRAV
jgi:hypothetical protein